MTGPRHHLYDIRNLRVLCRECHAARTQTMLRVHCVQLFHNLSDPGMEDLLYEVESVRRFAGLRLTGPLPDETTIRPVVVRHPDGAPSGLP